MEPTFDHIAMAARDISETVRFYKEQFPLAEVLYEDPSWALLRIGSLKLAFVLEAQHPPHVAFRTETRVELERIANNAKKCIDIHRDASESFYVEDPSGNAIEIIFYPKKPEEGP